MMHMLKTGRSNGVHGELEKLSLNSRMQCYLLSRGQNTLPAHLRELIKLRNGHAHISAMSREKFEELRKLVLPTNSNQETCLVKILRLKREVFKT